MADKLRDESWWRSWLSTTAFWIILAYLGLVALTLILYFVNGARARDAALRRDDHQRELAVRRAATIGAARNAVDSCLNARPILIKTNGFVHAVLAFHEVAIENAQATLAATPLNDPTRPQKRANVKRLLATVPPIKRTHFHVPTVAECLARGDTVYGRVKPSPRKIPPKKDAKP